MTIANFTSTKAYSTFFSIVALVLTISCNNSGSGVAGVDSTDGSKNAANMDSSGAKSVKPNGPKPDWAPGIHPEMQAVIENLVSYNAPAIESLSAADARKNPTPATAVMDLIKENNIAVSLPEVDTVGKNIPVSGGTVHVRIYTPRATMTSYPIILYIHGGGWVIADINTYDASAASMAEQTKSVVVSVNYRQGPEFKFPTAHNDCFAAYEWMLKNAAALKGDTSKVGLLGESAGGNLAANVAIMARDKHIKTPLAEVLVYPIAQSDMEAPAYIQNAMAKPLNKAMMAWFYKNYLPSQSAVKDPRIDLTKADLKGLPPTTIITAQYDPLQSDGQMLRDKMKAEGIDVTYKDYDGVTHEFFGMAAIVPEAKQAQAFAAGQLNKAFGK
ncbi:MAG: alpha/beta hydrolase [Chitinophagaceae bacterium]